MDYLKYLNAALAHGGEFADLFFEDKEGLSISLEEGKVESLHYGQEKGVGVRVIADLATAYAYTDGWEDSAILEACAAAKNLSSQEARLKIADLREQKRPQLFRVAQPAYQAAISDKVDLVMRAQNAAYEFSPKISQVIVRFKEYRQKILVVNSYGELTQDERIYLVLLVHTFASDNGQIQTGYEGRGGFVGMEVFEETTPEEIGRAAAAQALTMCEAKPAPAGVMPVVIGPAFGGVLFHEACGHGLEADFIYKKASIYTDKIGEQVASPLVTLVDDATIPGKQGSYLFDDEGIASEKTVLIEQGILKTYLCDRLEGMKLGINSTGNGRRQSYFHLPIPRMSNTFLAAGESDPKDLIASVKQGLYVKKMGGGQVDIVSGDFVFSVTEGYLIEDGQLTSAVKGANLTGNGPQVLSDVAGVGTDLELDRGTGHCGKGQMVPVSVGQPTIFIPKMTVGGTNVV